MASTSELRAASCELRHATCDKRHGTIARPHSSGSRETDLSGNSGGRSRSLGLLRRWKVKTIEMVEQKPVARSRKCREAGDAAVSKLNYGHQFNQACHYTPLLELFATSNILNSQTDSFYNIILISKLQLQLKMQLRLSPLCKAVYINKICNLTI